MPKVKISPAGEHGIIKDVLPVQLAKNAWSDGNNVMMSNGAVVSTFGYGEYLGTPTVAPKFVINYDAYWVYAGDAAIYTVDDDGTDHTDRSKAGGYTSGDWSGCLLGSIPVLTNNTEAPQAWPSGVDFADLANWPASTTCKIIRTFGSYLFALDITESGTRNKKLLRWSHPADAGAVPSSWDYTDDTLKAGRQEMSQMAGDLKDALSLGSEFFIYSNGSVWRAVQVSNQYVFQFQQAFGDFGVIGENCVADIGGKHAVFSDGDILVHDGYKKESIVHGAVKEWIFQNINPDHKDNCFVVADKNRANVLFCFPTEGNTYPNKAWVWNWRTKESGIKDIPSITHASSGSVTNSADTWDGDSGAWDDDTTQWSDRLTTTGGNSITAASYGDTKLYTLEIGYSANGADIVSEVTREDIGLGGIAMLTEIRPHMDTTNTPINIYIGRKFTLDDSTQWFGPYPFDPASEYKINCRVTGRYFSLRFRYVGQTQWKLAEYILNAESAGDR